jgi:hypothetical protein
MLLALLMMMSNSVFATQYIRSEQGFSPIVSLEKMNLRTSPDIKRFKNDLDRHVEQDLSKLTANRKTILSKP